MAIKNSYNFRRINQQLSTSGVVGANRLKGLAAEGYEVVINLLPDDSEHAVKDERAAVEEQGVTYVYIPVDFAAPTLEDYRRFAEALDAAGQSKTHIHCAANFRVSGFYSIYAQQRGLWDQAQADAFVANLWDPSLFPAWQALIEEERIKTP